MSGYISDSTKNYINSMSFPHFVNSRPLVTISEVSLTGLDLLKAGLISGSNILLAGAPSTGKTQAMWDIIQNIVGEDNSMAIREELHRGDIKGLFRYLDRNAYEQTGRSDKAVQTRNIEKALFGIEEITRSGPLQNSLFAVVDGEIYDDSTGLFYRLGKDTGGTEKFHVCIATGNLPNGETDYTSQLSEALATRFHLFLNMSDLPRTQSDDTDIYLQRRSPRVAFSKETATKLQQTRLEQLLDAHKEVIGLRREADMTEDAVLKYFSFGLDYCSANSGGEFAVISHSKRYMEHAWPKMCATCTKSEELKYQCAAARPTEPRHTNAVIRIRNALEAVACAKGAEVTFEHTVQNLLEAMKIILPYTLQWNPHLVNGECMGNTLSASHGLVAKFKEGWKSVRDEFQSEAILAGTGQLYDADERKSLGMTPASGKEDLLPCVSSVAKTKKGKKADAANPLILFGYLREVLDDYNRRAQEGNL